MKMGFFTKPKPEILAIDHALRESFQNVRHDTQKLHQWVMFLHHKAQQQEHHIAHLTQQVRDLNIQLSFLPRSSKDIRDLIDAHYDAEPLKRRINEIDEKVDRLKEAHAPVASHISHLHERIDRVESDQPSTRAKLKDRLVQRITRNSQEYVKNLMISLIRKYEKISALQLRDIIVNEQTLCSKSSFYRILEQAEKEEEIGVMTQGKEKVYFYKAAPVRHREP